MRQVSACGCSSISVAMRSGNPYSPISFICLGDELGMLIRCAARLWRGLVCTPRRQCRGARLHCTTFHRRQVGARRVLGVQGPLMARFFRLLANVLAVLRLASVDGVFHARDRCLCRPHNRGVVTVAQGDGGHVTAWRLAIQRCKPRLKPTLNPPPTLSTAPPPPLPPAPLTTSPYLTTVFRCGCSDARGGVSQLLLHAGQRFRALSASPQRALHLPCGWLCA